MAKLTDNKGEVIHYDEDNVDEKILKEFAGKNPAHVIQAADAEARKQRRPRQQTWIVDLNMLAGVQWLRWSRTARIVQRMDDMLDSRRPDIVRAVDNFLLPAYNLKLSRLIQTQHVPEVVPAPGRGDQVDNAENQTRYLQSLWWHRKLRREDVRLKGWLTACGHSWLKVLWDEKEGLPTFRHKSPFQVNVVPYGVIDVDYADAIIEAAAVAIERLRQKYPKALQDWKPSQQRQLEEEADTILASTDSFVQHQGKTRNIRGMVAVREVYRQPCDKHPAGYKALVTRHRTLELKPLVDPDLWAPYIQFKYQEFPGALYPPGMVEPVVPLQVLHNKHLSDMYGYIHRKCHARRLIRESAELTPEKFDDLGTDLVWQDDPELGDVPPVQWDVPPPLEADYWRMAELIRRSRDDALNIHEPTRGAPGSNVQSGKQVELLQAQDEVHITPTLELIKEGWERAYQRALILTANHQTEPITLSGLDPRTFNKFDIQDFMMDKDVESYLVHVRAISHSPYDKLIALENNRLLLQQGGLQHLPPETVVRLFEHGYEASLFDAYSADHVAAKEENKRILAGEPIDHVNAWDNDEVHVPEHRKICLSLRFAEVGHVIQKAMVTHLTAHQNRMASAMQAKQEMEVPQGAG